MTRQTVEGKVALITAASQGVGFEMKKSRDLLYPVQLGPYELRSRPERLAKHAPLNAPDHATFYGGEDKGYTDYPFLESLAACSRA